MNEMDRIFGYTTPDGVKRHVKIVGYADHPLIEIEDQKTGERFCGDYNCLED